MLGSLFHSGPIIHYHLYVLLLRIFTATKTSNDYRIPEEMDIKFQERLQPDLVPQLLHMTGSTMPLAKILADVSSTTPFLTGLTDMSIYP